MADRNPKTPLSLNDLEQSSSSERDVRASVEHAIRDCFRERTVFEILGAVEVVTDAGNIHIDFDPFRDDPVSPVNSSVSSVKFEASANSPATFEVSASSPATFEVSPNSPAIFEASAGSSTKLESPTGSEGSHGSRELPGSGNKSRRKNFKPIRRIELSPDAPVKEADDEAPLDLCLNRGSLPHPRPARPALPTLAPAFFNPLFQLLGAPESVSDPFSASFQPSMAISSLLRPPAGPILPPLPQASRAVPEMTTPAAPGRRVRARSSGVAGGRVRRGGASRCFRCNQCSRAFPALALLSHHTFQVHKAFRCMVCSSNFTQRSNLQRHSLKHVGFKPFVCNICARAYYRKDHLVRHIELTHPGHEPRANITSKLSSSECLDYLEDLRRAGQISELGLPVARPESANGSHENDGPAAMEVGDENLRTNGQPSNSASDSSDNAPNNDV